MKIVLPLLGRGSKFIAAGIAEPKPLIKIKGKYMFEWALESISGCNLEKDAIFIISKEHVDNWHLDKVIREVVGEKTYIEIMDIVPQGAAKSVLFVRSHIDTSEELIIYNTDQMFAFKMKKYIANLPKNVSGLIPYFHATHPKWSYIETDDKGFVKKTVEKEVISNKATIGLYYFRHGHDFVWAADQMIKKELMIGNEYYVCPTYNELIADGKKIASVYIDNMWGLGTPEDVMKFEKYYKPVL